MEDNINLHNTLSINAAIPYTAIASSSRQQPPPSSRPLEFPAPIVDRAITMSADIIDHRTGHPFRATSVLMRRAVHSKSCPCSSRVASPTTGSCCSAGNGNSNIGGASFDSSISMAVGTSRPLNNNNGRQQQQQQKQTQQQYRTRDPDRIHSWHNDFNSPSRSLVSRSTSKDHAPLQQKQIPKHHEHRRVHSNNSNKNSSTVSIPLPSQQPIICTGPSTCDLPTRAYCVVKKLANTTHGSIRLCVVLQRVSQHIINYARSIESSTDDSFDAAHHHNTSTTIPTWTTTNEMVAIKVINWSKYQCLRGQHLEDPIKELSALQQLIGNRVSLTYINPILECLQSESHLYSVFPYVSGGDLVGVLLDAMEERRDKEGDGSGSGRIDEELGRVWFCQLLAAISHLQKKGICHRDISLENILVDENNNLRLIDFGLSLRVPFVDPNNRNLSTDVSANTPRKLIKTQGQCGQMSYMAPEIAVRSDTFDGFAIDLWSAGIVLFELLIGKKPFLMPDPVDRNFCTIALEGGLASLLQTKGIDVSDGAVDLLQKMLWSDPAKRLTLAEIVNHPWVQGDQKKQLVKSTEEDTIDRRWFVRNNSIDDMGETTKLANLLLIRDSTAGSMASTVGTSDVESQITSSQTLSSSGKASPCNAVYEEQPEHHERKGEVVEAEELAEINKENKRNWLAWSLKGTKWRRG